MGMKEDNKLISCVQNAKHDNCKLLYRYGIEARRIASSFLSCVGSPASSLSSMLLSAPTMRSHILLTATGVYTKQKK